VNLTQEAKEFGKTPTVSQIVEWIHFGCHGTVLTVLQARERETVAQITLRWPNRKVWTATGGATCRKGEKWEPGFGKELAILRAAEELQDQIILWRLDQMSAKVLRDLKELCQAVPPDPPAKPTEGCNEWLATDDPANYDVTFNRGSNEQVVAR